MHYEAAILEFEIARELADDEGRGHECDRRIEYAKIEAILAVAEELKLARERKTFVLPSGTMINLDAIAMAWRSNDKLIVCANGVEEEYYDAGADVLAEALGMTKKETE